MNEAVAHQRKQQDLEIAHGFDEYRYLKNARDGLGTGYSDMSGVGISHTNEEYQEFRLASRQDQENIYVQEDEEQQDQMDEEEQIKSDSSSQKESKQQIDDHMVQQK